MSIVLPYPKCRHRFHFSSWPDSSFLPDFWPWHVLLDDSTSALLVVVDEEREVVRVVEIVGAVPVADVEAVGYRELDCWDSRAPSSKTF